MKILKSLSVFIVAVLLMAAGVLLPDLLVRNKLNQSFDDPEYIDADNLSPYGEFYASKQKVTKMLGHYKMLRRDTTAYELVTYCDGDTIDKFRTGYYEMIKFIKYWNNQLYTDIEEEGVREEWIASASDGFVFGSIGFANEFNGEYGEVVFDLETGIPAYIRYNIPYTNSIRIETLWQRFVDTYAEFTQMEFTNSAVQSGAVVEEAPAIAYDHSLLARNYDSSVLLIGDVEYEDGFILQFSLE
ncbi:MAG: hypothetical protein K6A80_00095 [Saccharofermentans sp.]|nr:hypothetical protein [Saccharofermentans sp.]